MKNKKVLKIAAILAVFIYIILLANTSFAGVLSSDINGIDDNKYPGVKSQIQTLQRQYGNYKFQVYYTGIDWTEAVTMEYQGHGKSPKNLFSKSSKYDGKWFCPICGNKTYDTGWYCASVEAIEYMMDPRNSLDKTSVYQFKNLEMPDVTADNIRTVINKNYASYSYLNNDEVINAIVKASADNVMNGYSILAKIVNEQGTGKSPLIKGQGYNGQYPGVYNFFNVGAYGNGSENVILNGLRYASNKGWTTKEKSILGGSEYYKTQYIGRGQKTLYYQRFNVVHEPSLFSHQYQQDIMGAQTSATLMKKYYEMTSTINTVEQHFIIPLYENMPKTACARPSTTENSVLEYDEAIVLVEGTIVKASPNSGRIIDTLNKGEKLKVLKKAKQPSQDGNYWDTVVTDISGTYGFVNRSQIDIEPPIYVFDSEYYAENNKDIVAILGNDKTVLLSHFLNSGIREGRKSSPTFWVAEYVAYNQDLKVIYGNDYMKFYEHYLYYGAAEGRRGSSEFDGTFYKYYYDLTNLDNIELMEHYLKKGRKSGKMGALTYEIECIVYDEQVYMDCNRDLLGALGNNPQAFKQHWLQYGLEEGRTSSLLYDAKTYKNFNRDLINAIGTSNKAFFEHFIRYGVNELRRTSLVFDISTYLEKNKEIGMVYGKNYILTFLHFRNFGISEGRSSSPVFDIKYYYDSDLKNVFKNDYKSLCIHFVNCGINEGRRASSEFDVNFYKIYYSDVEKLDNRSLMEHYITVGKNSGRIGGLDYETENIVYDEEVYMNCNQDLVPFFGNDPAKYKKHWFQSGINEGRKSSLTFDIGAYKDYNRDLYQAIGTSNKAFFEHFVKWGINELRSSSYVLEISTYLNNNPEIRNTYGKNYKAVFLHFKNYGINENRKTSNRFDIQVYKSINIDLKPFMSNDKDYYIHYIRSGIYEKRIAI